jgi:hypothetical protein
VNPLFAVRERLRDGGAATLSQLAAELHLSPDLVRELLAHWQRRGHVETLSVGSNGCGSGCSSGGCNGCQVMQRMDLTGYAWRDGG